jgi:hypothetical protein
MNKLNQFGTARMAGLGTTVFQHRPGTVRGSAACAMCFLVAVALFSIRSPLGRLTPAAVVKTAKKTRTLPAGTREKFIHSQKLRSGARERPLERSQFDLPDRTTTTAMEPGVQAR